MIGREDRSAIDNRRTERIAFWRESMELGHRFMRRMMEYPVEECGESLASIAGGATNAGIDMEFSDTPIVDSVPRIFEIREGLLEPLLSAAREMNDRGWVMKVEDGFRTARMQRGLAVKASVFDLILERAAWEAGHPDPPLDLVQRRVSTLVANWPKVAGHMSGCAVDIAVLDRETRSEVDRGGPYLEMSERTPMWSPFVSAQALHNRAEITAIMERHGFAAYPAEFWHYSQGDVFAEQLRCTGIAGRYAAVTRDQRTGSIEPIAHLAEPLNSTEAILEQIELAKRRRRLQTPVKYVASTDA
jgi:D-alanyl-D-alanine dipeptidase